MESLKNNIYILREEGFELWNLRNYRELLQRY